MKIWLVSLAVCVVPTITGCRSSTGTDPHPGESPSAYSTLLNERRGLSTASFLSGFTDQNGATWFGGSGGLLLYREVGGNWQSEAIGSPDLVSGIWGTGGELLGAAGTKLFSRGTPSWEEVALPFTGAQFLELRGNDEGTIWLAGTGGTILVRENGAWRRATTTVGEEIWGLAVDRPDLVVAVGQNGTVLESAGGAEFVEVASPSSETLFSVAVDQLGRYVAVGANGTILLRDGDTWELVPSPTSVNLFAVSSDGAGSFLAAGDSGVMLRGNGVSWQPEPVGGASENLRALTGPPGAQLVAGWTGTILEESTGWKTTETGTRIYSVHEGSDNKPLAVGRGGIAFERTGGRWQEVSTPTSEILLGVHGPSGDDRLVVGDHGTVFHVSAGVWQRESVPTELAVRSVWYDGDRALAVGEGGLGLVRVAGSWQTVPTGTSKYLRHLWGNSFDRLWAVGDSGTILRWNGDAFVPTSSPVTTNLRGGISAGQDNTLAVGDDGTILRFQGGVWVREFSPILNDIRAVHLLDGVVYIAGELGLAYSLRDGEWSAVLTDNPGYWLGLGGHDELIAVGETGAIAEGVK